MFFCIRISDHQVCKVKVFNEMKARSNRVFRNKLKFKVAKNSFQHLNLPNSKVALNPMYIIIFKLCQKLRFIMLIKR